MRRLILAALFLLSAVVPALGQTTCTSATVPNNPNRTNPFAVEFGWDGKDSAGGVVDAATIAATQVRVSFNGVAQALVALPAPVSVDPANGCRWYRLPGYTLPKAPRYEQIVQLVSADGEGAAPAPFVFAIVGHPPSVVIKQHNTQQ